MQADEAFRAARDSFWAVAGYAPVGIVLLQHGRFEYVNPQAASLVGYRADEMIGKMDIHDILCRNDWERVQSRLQQCENGERADLRLSAEAMRKDGKRFLLELRGRSVTFKENPAVLCYWRDGTRQRDLTEQLVQVREAERRRLGEELHDGVAARLTGISMLLDSHIQALKQGEDLTARQLRNLQQKVNDGIQQVRRLSHGLNPVGLCGSNFPERLAELVGSMDAGFEGECVFEEDGDRHGLAEETASSLYHIAQEAVVNAARHSEAERIRLKLCWTAGDVLLTIEDDGVGFRPDEEAGGIGLASMRHRARRLGADLGVESTLGAGTTVRCWLPASH